MFCTPAFMFMLGNEERKKMKVSGGERYKSESKRSDAVRGTNSHVMKRDVSHCYDVGRGQGQRAHWA